MKRNTQTPEAQRLIEVMVCNPSKARPKKGENSNDDATSPSDDVDSCLDDIEIIKEVPAPKPKNSDIGDDDDDIFILEISAPLGAYAINSCSLAHSPGQTINNHTSKCNW